MVCGSGAVLICAAAALLYMHAKHGHDDDDGARGCVRLRQSSNSHLRRRWEHCDGTEEEDLWVVIANNKPRATLVHRLAPACGRLHLGCGFHRVAYTVLRQILFVLYNIASFYS